MKSFLRSLVALPKQSHFDSTSSQYFDLSYLTSQIIVCSGPVSLSLESFYRHPIADLVKFLDLNHNWHIFNFRGEGPGYSDGEVRGKVSHYPFPDHQPLTITMMKRFVEEVEIYIESDRNVAVLHCKAGKGRSGMMACAYLISKILDDGRDIKMPSSTRIVSSKDILEQLDSVEDTTKPEQFNSLDIKKINSLDPQNIPVISHSNISLISHSNGSLISHSNISLISHSNGSNSHKTSSIPQPVQDILDYYTSIRMKPFAGEGISIKSQKRYLNYWNRFLRSSPEEQRKCLKQGRCRIIGIRLVECRNDVIVSLQEYKHVAGGVRIRNKCTFHEIHREDDDILLVTKIEPLDLKDIRILINGWCYVWFNTYFEGDCMTYNDTENLKTKQFGLKNQDQEKNPYCNRVNSPRLYSCRNSSIWKEDSHNKSNFELLSEPTLNGLQKFTIDWDNLDGFKGSRHRGTQLFRKLEFYWISSDST